MKFTIDTKTKTISINEIENVGEFFEKLKIMLHNDEWKDYKIMQEYYSYPIFPQLPTTNPYNPNNPNNPNIVYISHT